jgi:hypothetical protein
LLPFLLVVKPSKIEMTCPSFLWQHVSFIAMCCQPSKSDRENRFSAITLAWCLAAEPSGNSTVWGHECQTKGSCAVIQQDSHLCL